MNIKSFFNLININKMLKYSILKGVVNFIL